MVFVHCSPNHHDMVVVVVAPHLDTDGIVSRRVGEWSLPSPLPMKNHVVVADVAVVGHSFRLVSTSPPPRQVVVVRLTT